MTFHHKFVHYTFSSVWIAEWLPFGKERPIWLARCSHFFCLFVILVFPRFGFESGFLYYLE